MTPEQTALVTGTADAALSGGRFAARFYEVLFATAPETRPLFRGDLDVLKLKFMNTLASVVGATEHPDLFGSILTHLGRQHRRYGVELSHYEPVGAALLTTLQDILGDRFTPEVREAWTVLYAEIAGHMQDGARDDGARNNI